MNTYSLGIDIGYSAVKMVLIDNNNSILYNNYQLHKGKINSTSEQFFNEIKNKFSIAKIEHGAVTGSIGKILSENILIKRVNEIAATIEGSTHLNSEVKSIIELGGQGAKY